MLVIGVRDAIQATVRGIHVDGLGRGVVVVGNLALLGLWLRLYAPVLRWLFSSFAADDFRLNQVLLGATLVLIARSAWTGDIRPRLAAAPHGHPPALALAVGGSIAYLVVERTLAIHILSAALFGLASFGLAGLWLTPGCWRRSLPAALLLVAALPFGTYSEVFLGYPARIVTAEIISAGLATMGVPAVNVDTILTLEHGVAQVDLPCSGIRSLWTGALFFLAATWLLRRPVDRWWLLAGVVVAALLLAANVVRVATLVVVGDVAGLPELAELAHVPLGVTAFAACCAAAVGLLRLRQPLSDDPGEGASPSDDWAPNPTGKRPPRRLAVTFSLLLVLLLLTALYRPRLALDRSAPAPAWAFPASLGAERMPLAAAEQAWLRADGAESVERYRFDWRGATGSVLLITSRDGRAHHLPERCFEVHGYAVGALTTQLISPSFPVRRVTLGGREAQAFATYWFQSKERVTEDYTARMWADLSSAHERWVLVSVLMDQPFAAVDDARPLYLALHEAVAGGLKGDRR